MVISFIFDYCLTVIFFDSMKHNFSAGPAILPKSVFEIASKSCLEYDQCGRSLLELSHRGPEFSAVMERAVQNVYDLTGLDERYAVLFLTGGASSQFFMIPMNLLDTEGVASYIDTGRWADKAIEEAKMFGQTQVVASSAEENYSYIPKEFDVDPRSTYLHITSNNTVTGSQYHKFPSTSVPLICDMSSDIFSRPINFRDFDLIYAGAQKNIGPAGTTLVIIKKELLGKVSRSIPTMLNYETHVKKGSMFNTPPVFSIYVCMLTMEWIKNSGGLEAMYQHNQAKADVLYQEIDRNALFTGMVKEEDRSLMNATFKLMDDSLQEAFLKKAEAAGCVGLKGHRSVGGLRASMYNALSLESVQALVDTMQSFEKEMG